jgi:hypothetical protein
MGRVKNMAEKHYLIELTTQLGVVVDDKEVTKSKSLYQIVMDKVQQSIDYQDLNEKDYQVKVLGEAS